VQIKQERKAACSLDQCALHGQQGSRSPWQPPRPSHGVHSLAPVQPGARCARAASEPGTSGRQTLAAAQVTAGADLGGSVAAALAAASMLLRPQDAAYADTLLAAAQKAYQFAQNSNRVKCGGPPVGARWRLRAGQNCTAWRWP
jgi:hypothetical protein